eukprot:1841521-Rhodomonas_salina.2
MVGSRDPREAGARTSAFEAERGSASMFQCSLNRGKRGLVFDVQRWGGQIAVGFRKHERGNVSGAAG